MPSPFRRLLAAPLLAALLLPAAAHADGVTKRALTFDVLTGPGRSTHCRVDADLYTPSGLSPAHPAAAMLATNGFGGSKKDFARLGAAYARRGYVFLAYSGLGFGGSGCRITLDDPDWDGVAARDLVSFLGGSKAATDGTRMDAVLRDRVSHDGRRRPDDPRVGMIGGSYGGQIQFAAASVDPRIDALNPQITWNDLAYSLTPNNTDLRDGVTSATPGVAKLDWPTLFSGVGVLDGFQEVLQNGDASHLDSTCPNFEPRVCPGLLAAAISGAPNAPTLALLRHASVSTYISKIRIPTFLAQGEHDTLFNLQESVATYRALLAQNTPVKLLWRSAGHSGGGLGTAESNPDDPERAYESRMELAWFDYYLRGIGAPPPLDFSFFDDSRPHGADAGAAVGSTPSYPAGTDRSLFLAAGGALVDDPSAAGSVDASMLAAPVVPGSQGNAFTGTTAGDLPGTSVAFASAPLAQDTTVAGVPRLHVSVSAPVFEAAGSGEVSDRLVLFAKLYDVAPDGTATLPANLLSAARIGDPRRPVDIELPGIVHRFAAGHRLRLVLATSNLTNRGNNLAGTVTVRSTPDGPGTLTLPVLGAPRGAAGTGPEGTTPYPAAPGAPTPQPAGLGGPRRAAPAAAHLPPRSCRTPRTLRFRLRHAPAGRRLLSAAVTVDGRRRATLRGRTLRRLVVLRRLPRGAFRVGVTVRVSGGEVRRSARIYPACR